MDMNNRLKPVIMSDQNTKPQHQMDTLKDMYNEK